MDAINKEALVQHFVAMTNQIFTSIALTSIVKFRVSPAERDEMIKFAERQMGLYKNTSLDILSKQWLDENIATSEEIEAINREIDEGISAAFETIKAATTE